MATILCARHPGPCTRRKQRRREGDLLILAEIITHSDGTKEQREYGRVNERTQEIVSANFIS